MLGLKKNNDSEAEFLELYNKLRETEGNNELLQESLEDLQLAIDDMGWAPLFGATPNADESGMRMDAIRRMTSQTRSLMAGNPLVRKGVLSRIGLIWGEGISVTGNRTKDVIKANDKLVFSPAARGELESALSTDGNVIFLLDRGTRKIIRIPLSQIGDFLVNPDDGETVQFVKRVWSTRSLAPNGEGAYSETKEVWYPTVEYVNGGGSIPTVIDRKPVEQAQAVNIVSVNKQLGWTWGVPDLLSVLFWARAYKEFLEAEYTLVRSLAKFAFKITDKRGNGAGARKAAVRVANPNNTQGIDAGATASMSGGMDMQAINKAGANVSFEAGEPLAAMVAAGLEVPLTIILSNPKQSTNNYEISLDPSTVKAMQARQDLWADELERMFVYLGAGNAKVTFPPIQSAPVHRVIQSIVTAASSGVIWPEEVRELIVKTLVDFGLDAKDKLPDPEEWAAYANPAQENPGTPPLNTPDNSNSSNRSPAGALADGDHEQRPSE